MQQKVLHSTPIHLIHILLDLRVYKNSLRNTRIWLYALGLPKNQHYLVLLDDTRSASINILALA